jgi:hypothetical protein
MFLGSSAGGGTFPLGGRRLGKGEGRDGGGSCGSEVADRAIVQRAIPSPHGHECPCYEGRRMNPAWRARPAPAAEFDAPP